MKKCAAAISANKNHEFNQPRKIAANTVPPWLCTGMRPYDTSMIERCGQDPWKFVGNILSTPTKLMLTYAYTYITKIKLIVYRDCKVCAFLHRTYK